MLGANPSPEDGPGTDGSHTCILIGQKVNFEVDRILAGPARALTKAGIPVELPGNAGCR